MRRWILLPLIFVFVLLPECSVPEAKASTATQVQETTPATTDPNGNNSMPTYSTWAVEPYMGLNSLWYGYLTAFGCWGLVAGTAYVWRCLQDAL